MAGGRGSRADNCKAQREAAGMTITSLAKKANVTDWTIRVLEAGGTTDSYVVDRIADALGISTATLGKKDLFK